MSSKYPLPNELKPSDAGGKSPDRGSLAAGLYILATPIGNARDISLRALDTLKGCDVIAAEDTRVTSKLLSIHGVSKPLIAYNDHNAPEMRPRILARLAQGEVAAEDVVSATAEELMDPAAAERWRATKRQLFAQHSVVDTQEALSNKVVVDTARCPQCKNTSLNLRLQVAAHLESSKAETWGSKDARSDDKVRFKCSKCNFSWSHEGG